MMSDPAERTLLNIPPAGSASGPRNDELYVAVRDAVSELYVLLGEMGRSRLGSVVYLVRDRANGQLVALKLDRTAGTDSEYALTVAPELDESIPSPGATCPYCNSPLAGWVQFCGRCGRDISGLNSGVTGFTPEQLLAAVNAVAEGSYEVLGEMRRARGGGVVYFARDLASGAIVALRLQRDDASASGEFSLGRTSVLKPLLESMGAEYASPTMLGTAPAIAQPSSQDGPRKAEVAAQTATASPHNQVIPSPAGHSKAELKASPAEVSNQRPPAPPVARPNAGGRTEVLSPLNDPAFTPRDARSSTVSAADGADGANGLPTRAKSRVGLVAGGLLIVAAIGAAAIIAISGGKDENALVGPALPAVDPAAPTVVTAPVPAPTTAAASSTAPSPAATPAASTAGADASTRKPAPPPADAVLIVDDLPSGAVLQIDGKNARAGSNTLRVGRHKLSVRASGYAPLEESKVLTAGMNHWAPKLRAEAVPQKSAPGDAPAAPVAPTSRVTCTSASTASDWDRARALCKDAAASGSAVAQRLLGIMQVNGYGGPADEGSGVNNLKAAATADDAIAQYELARIYRHSRTYRNDALAYQYFRRAAAQGNADAEYQTGLALERSLGVKRNLTEAFLWYEQAAKHGNVDALAATGVFLKKGQGVERDERRAVEILKKAADAGNGGALFHLGEMHEKGMAGLPRSRDVALELYKKGAAAGNDEARKAVKRLQ